MYIEFIHGLFMNISQDRARARAFAKDLHEVAEKRKHGKVGDNIYIQVDLNNGHYFGTQDTHSRLKEIAQHVQSILECLEDDEKEGVLRDFQVITSSYRDKFINTWGVRPLAHLVYWLASSLGWGQARDCEISRK